MADGILGLGSSGSVDLNQDLINKLKESETNAYIAPIEKNIEESEATIEAVNEISAKIDEFLSVIEGFDLYNTSTNVFDEVSATTTGTAVSFNAADTSNINPGTIAVTVDQLATKDVYQSDIITDTSATMDSGILSITLGSSTYDFDTTDKTYEEIVTQINYNSSIEASLEQVGDNSYRMIIKSVETGLDNAITIGQTGDLNLGYDNDLNHVVSAQNMKAKIDGVDYNLSSNKVTMENGLIITASEKGDASISIERDDTYVIEQINKIATVYNELVELVDSYTKGSEDSPALISDSSTLRGIVGDIKNMFYDTYGLSDEENAFVYGISFNKDGRMEIDAGDLSKALTDNYDDLKELFIGYAEKEGIGTRITAYLDDLDSLDGIMTTYEERLSKQLKDLNDSQEEETERIDTKYQQLASQFAAYTVIITQMENSFSSLKLIMNMDKNDN
ncbi:flagellar filament capping protein FliD [Campylobacterota bacterium DY0563]